MVARSPGVIAPEHLYSADELMRRLAWSESTLGKARRAGLRTLYRFGKRYFRGVDVIDYIAASPDSDQLA